MCKLTSHSTTVKAKTQPWLDGTVETNADEEGEEEKEEKEKIWGDGE